jgi:hypothetical protein
VKLFFDNCTSPVLADTIHGFVRHLGHSAHHVKDLPCGRHAPDDAWIKFLDEDEAVWIVVTGDDRIRRNRAERTAFRAAGLRGFVLAPAYQRTPINQQASFLLWRWPEMEQILSLLGGAALYELPMTRKSKIKPLPL